MTGNFYRDTLTSSTNDQGSINYLNSDIFSVNDHFTDNVLEDIDENVQLTVEE